MQKQITLQDILYQYGEQYIRDNPVSPQEKGLIRLLTVCGTSLMGTHLERCDSLCYYKPILKNYHVIDAMFFPMEKSPLGNLNNMLVKVLG